MKSVKRKEISMERLQARGLTKDEVVKQFKVKKNDVLKIEERPTYALIKHSVMT